MEQIIIGILFIILGFYFFIKILSKVKNTENLDLEKNFRRGILIQGCIVLIAIGITIISM